MIVRVYLSVLRLEVNMEQSDEKILSLLHKFPRRRRRKTRGVYFLLYQNSFFLFLLLLKMGFDFF